MVLRGLRKPPTVLVQSCPISSVKEFKTVMLLLSCRFRIPGPFQQCDRPLGSHLEVHSFLGYIQGTK